MTGRPPPSVTVPVATKNTNSREHWAVKAKRLAEERKWTGWALRALGAWRPTLPCTVRLVRRGPRLMDRGDNLNIAGKAIRDEVAKWLGVDDADPRVTWTYDQEETLTRTRKRPAEPQGTRVEFLPAPIGYGQVNTGCATAGEMPSQGVTPATSNSRTEGAT